MLNLYSQIFAIVQVIPYELSVIVRICSTIILATAIMTYKSVPGKRSSAKVVHLLLHLIALAAGVLGLIAVFKSKKEAGLSDMYTLHSWLGMSAICAFGLQVNSISSFPIFLILS